MTTVKIKYLAMIVDEYKTQYYQNCLTGCCTRINVLVRNIDW